ncbi:MAG: flagellar motor control protein ZomB [Corynebacterium sp.]|uniref:flagellar motor control protein ZomB n=1 Tax=Corynebacterium sp. TaxID=1720 RepID=UPI0026DBCA00|nr:flagellar motor control protein ZomB [Corynebacterium sp.]MDO5099790.1 flagellar motor control protein ZomB [Corynebacterium sp.]
MTNARSLTSITGLLSAVIVAALAFYGGWQRKWISDDGLIVLRTVRNLLAGNGPVFNAGERVEANTSTLWQYIIYLGALVSDARLETIAMWAALIFTTLALFIATYATAQLHRGTSAVALIPVGGILYIALPPARDFATSGLEWGLSILWIAIQWLLLVAWAHSDKQQWVYLLAFWSGMSWLVRPELALYGGLAGIILLVFERKSWWKILLVAIPVPLSYQIFRMGYYGLLVPHTAVAKSASGSQWASGWNYLADFSQPYTMWLAAIIVVVLGAITIPPLATMRKQRVIIALVIACAAIHFLYIMRVGGDFMHGRMLLLPLFTLLLPLGVVSINRNLVTSAATGILVLCGMGWAAAAVIGGHPYELPEEGQELDIVDERTFWQLASYRDAPTYFAEDFQTARNMNHFVEQVAVGRDINAGQLLQIRLNKEPLVLSWEPVPRSDATGDLSTMPMSLTMINLGMTSMNAPLDVRVLDNMGLANPLAGRQPRMPDARVGHDKNLPLEWQLADSAVAIEDLPEWVDADYVERARQILYTPEYQRLFESYRGPMTAERFFKNIGYSFTEGRSLQFTEDPYAYNQPLPVANPQPINWPREIALDPPRG